MAKVVASIFDKYINVLFSDFTTKNVSSALLKGHVDAKNVSVRKELLKELLSPVFPNIEIRKALCESVSVRIPISKLNSEPTSVHITNLKVVLEEPQQFSAAKTRLLDIFKPKGKTSSASKKPKPVNWNFGLRIAFSCSVQIDQIHVRLESLQGLRGFRPPAVEVEVNDLQLVSVDERWSVASLKQCWAASSKNRSKVLVFKECRIGSIVVYLCPAAEQRQQIVYLSLTARVALSLMRKGLLPSSISIEADIDSVKITLSKEGIRDLFLLLLSLQRCLYRTLATSNSDIATDLASNQTGIQNETLKSLKDLTSSWGDAKKQDLKDIMEEDFDDDVDDAASVAMSVTEFTDGLGTGAPVPELNLKVFVQELQVQLTMEQDQIYIVRLNTMSNPLTVLGSIRQFIPSNLPSHTKVGPVDPGHVFSSVSVNCPLIMIERIYKSSRMALVTLDIDSLGLEFLHPRPPPPAIGWAVDCTLHSCNVSMPLDEAAALYSALISPEVMSWLLIDPSVFPRLEAMDNPFLPHNSEFSADLKVNSLSVSVPLCDCNEWYTSTGIPHAVRLFVPFAQVSAASHSEFAEAGQSSSRAVDMSITLTDVKALAGPSSLRPRSIISTPSNFKSSVPHSAWMCFATPSASIFFSFPAMPITQNNVDENTIDGTCFAERLTRVTHADASTQQTMSVSVPGGFGVTIKPWQFAPTAQSAAFLIRKGQRVNMLSHFAILGIIDSQVDAARPHTAGCPGPVLIPPTVLELRVECAPSVVHMDFAQYHHDSTCHLDTNPSLQLSLGPILLQGTAPPAPQMILKRMIWEEKSGSRSRKPASTLLSAAVSYLKLDISCPSIQGGTPFSVLSADENGSWHTSNPQMKFEFGLTVREANKESLAELRTNADVFDVTENAKCRIVKVNGSISSIRVAACADALLSFISSIIPDDRSIRSLEPLIECTLPMLKAGAWMMEDTDPYKDASCLALQHAPLQESKDCSQPFGADDTTTQSLMHTLQSMLTRAAKTDNVSNNIIILTGHVNDVKIQTFTTVCARSTVSISVDSVSVAAAMVWKICLWEAPDNQYMIAGLINSLMAAFPGLDLACEVILKSLQFSVLQHPNNDFVCPILAISSRFKTDDVSGWKAGSGAKLFLDKPIDVFPSPELLQAILQLARFISIRIPSLAKELLKASRSLSSVWYKAVQTCKQLEDTPCTSKISHLPATENDEDDDLDDGLVDGDDGSPLTSVINLLASFASLPIDSTEDGIYLNAAVDSSAAAIRQAIAALGNAEVLSHDIEQSLDSEAVRSSTYKQSQDSGYFEGLELGFPWSKHVASEGIDHTVYEDWVNVLDESATSNELLPAAQSAEAMEERLLAEIEEAKKFGDMDRASALMQRLWSIEQPESDVLDGPGTSEDGRSGQSVSKKKEVWAEKFAIVRSCGLLLLFESSNLSVPPTTSIDILDASIGETVMQSNPCTLVEPLQGSSVVLRVGSRGRALANVLNAVGRGAKSLSSDSASQFEIKQNANRRLINALAETIEGARARRARKQEQLSFSQGMSDSGRPESSETAQESLNLQESQTSALLASKQSTITKLGQVHDAMVGLSRENINLQKRLDELTLQLSLKDQELKRVVAEKDAEITKLQSAVDHKQGSLSASHTEAKSSAMSSESVPSVLDVQNRSSVSSSVSSSSRSPAESTASVNSPIPAVADAIIGTTTDQSADNDSHWARAAGWVVRRRGKLSKYWVGCWLQIVGECMLVSEKPESMGRETMFLQNYRLEIPKKQLRPYMFRLVKCESKSHGRHRYFFAANNHDEFVEWMHSLSAKCGAVRDQVEGVGDGGESS